jgi:hypothetical protein
MWLNLAAASGQKVTAAEGGAQARNWLRGCRASKANGKQESGNGCLEVAVLLLAPDLLIIWASLLGHHAFSSSLPTALQAVQKTCREIGFDRL